MSSGLVDIGLDTADSYARRGTTPRLKNKKKNRPIFFELLRLVKNGSISKFNLQKQIIVQIDPTIIITKSHPELI